MNIPVGSWRGVHCLGMSLVVQPTSDLDLGGQSRSSEAWMMYSELEYR
jgi:hypothetical protein